jgi:hypothetical protein
MTDPSPKPADPYGATVISAAPEPDVRQRVSVALSPPAFPRAPVVAPVMKAGFEAASAVCNDWAAEGADAIRSVPPHSGSYACRICATGDAPSIAIGHGAGPLTAGRYVLTAWLRKRPNNAGPEAATASLEADTASGVVAATSPVVLGNDYAQLQVTLDLTQAATAIRARIGAVASATQCVLIDDVLVERAD